MSFTASAVVSYGILTRKSMLEIILSVDNHLQYSKSFNSYCSQRNQFIL